jgi:hypothetical protein
VFDQAALLLKARPELNGDTAYWMARRLVDLTLAQQPAMDADSGPSYAPRMDEAPVLMLAP